MDASAALWTFPAIVLAAMMIAWAAECGQFYISQGLALAVLAWIQTIPEFAVEAVIVLEAARDPEKLHLVTANYTGSLRLFLGLGWPMVYFISMLFRKKQQRDGKPWRIRLDDEHSIAVLSLLPALVYFMVIYFKGTLSLVDAVVLGAVYFAYLYLLSKMPPQDQEETEDLGPVPRYIMSRRPFAVAAWIIGLFLAGALLIFFVAEPFLHSMLAVAVALGISQFVFVQWVAPFLSEFPEKLSAFHWARKVSKAPMALVNMVSSSINQWTVLVALIPVIYSFKHGHGAFIPFDEHQRVEILLTIAQSWLGFLFLVKMDFRFIEAAGLFALWLVQFCVPGVREEITWVYGAWGLVETVRLGWVLRGRNAFGVFAGLCRSHFFVKK